jgi:hypothetical protein
MNFCANCQVISANDLLAAKLKSSSTEILLWLGHHARQQRTRMALTLVDKVLNSSF